MHRERQGCKMKPGLLGGMTSNLCGWSLDRNGIMEGDEAGGVGWGQLMACLALVSSFSQKEGPVPHI